MTGCIIIDNPRQLISIVRSPVFGRPCSFLSIKEEFDYLVEMGNCFGSSSAATEPQSPHRPPKKQKTDHDDVDQKYVTDQVLKLRNEAETYHDKVVKCAKESQAAYKAGNKKKAHDLSEDKKKFQVKRDDANNKAATLILQAQKWQTTGEIDLHGLHLDEAMDATEKFLKHWSKKSTKDTVLVITGAGHHSANNKAIIRPKVEQLLKKQKLRYESVNGDGAFKVHIKPSQ